VARFFTYLAIQFFMNHFRDMTPSTPFTSRASRATTTIDYCESSDSDGFVWESGSDYDRPADLDSLTGGISRTTFMREARITS
jgi:hypothetical protein